MIKLLILALVGETVALHLYAAAENTYLVSQSENLKAIYSCTNNIIEYHRIVWTKSGSSQVYLEGHCYLMINENWLSFQDFGKEKEANTSMSQVLLEFNKKCEDPLSEMKDDLRIKLGLTKIHSEYEFFSNGSFVNLQEKNTELNSIFESLKNV